MPKVVKKKKVAKKHKSAIEKEIQADRNRIEKTMKLLSRVNFDWDLIILVWSNLIFIIKGYMDKKYLSQTCLIYVERSFYGLPSLKTILKNPHEDLKLPFKTFLTDILKKVDTWHH